MSPPRLSESYISAASRRRIVAPAATRGEGEEKGVRMNDFTTRNFDFHLVAVEYDTWLHQPQTALYGIDSPNAVSPTLNLNIVLNAFAGADMMVSVVESDFVKLNLIHSTSSLRNRSNHARD